MKCISKKVKKLFLTFAVLIVAIVLGCSTIVFASGSILEENYPEIYKQIAMNFFKEQYEHQDIDYENVSVAIEADLYDSEENVVAKSVVLQRDKKYDYVVLNLTDYSIDEFGFDDSSAYDRFSKKTYYTGTLEYFTKESNRFKSVDKGELYSSAEFECLSKEITNKYEYSKKNASKHLKSGGNPLPNPNKTGYNGFYDYSDMYSFNINKGYELYDCKFDGLTAVGSIGELSFFSQSQFNSVYNTRNSCGPTALTNLCLYLEWCGITNKDRIVNAIYGDAYVTFDIFRELTHHNNNYGVYNSVIPSAFKTYAENQNYNYYVKSNLSTFDEFKDHIDRGCPIVTFINLLDNGNRDYFGHFVLTLGYMQFQSKADNNIYSTYLRVVDGWNTCNEGRYIDFSGYWDTVDGTALRFVN